jgi:uncharacterized protein
MFVNLPVKDLARAVEFFTRLGFAFDHTVSDDKAACMVVGEDACVMLLQERFFQAFTRRPAVETAIRAETFIAVSADSRADVDDTADTALAAGGAKARPPEDHGFMYTRSFHDLDGHLWEIMWMDPGALERGT